MTAFLRYKRFVCFKLLLAQPAVDCSIPDSNGLNAFDLCLQQKAYSLSRLFIKQFPPETLASWKIDPSRSSAKKLSTKNLESGSADDDTLAVLVTGAGLGGKSTIIRTIHQHFYRGYEQTYFADFAQHILNNLLYMTRTVATYSVLLADEYGIANTRVAPENEAIRLKFSRMDDESFKLTPQLAREIETLWRDPGIVETMRHQDKYQIHANAQYWIDNILRLAQENYLPTMADLLHVRMRTTGFDQIQNVTVPALESARGARVISVLDVGGVRTERRKWMSLKTNFSCIIFVASLADYRMNCFEDARQNRLKEALALFAKMLEVDMCKNAHFVVVLTGLDLFEKCLKDAPIEKFFEEYEGGNSVEKGIEFVKEKFRKVVKMNSAAKEASQRNGDRIVDIQCISAVHTESVKKMFESAIEGLL